MQKESKNAILSPRARRLRLWVRRVAGDCTASGGGRLSALAGDAGFRRYYRLTGGCTASGGGRRRIVVDDPSPTQLRKFLAVQDAFAAAAVTVPARLAVDKKNGFLLLEDFGDLTYSRVLFDSADSDSAADSENLYAAALRTLIKIQKIPAQFPPFPPYGESLLRREMALFGNWYCARHLRQPLAAAEKRASATAADFLQAAMRAQPQVAVHRDYHSRNLMALSGADAPRRAPGVLDFQDAVSGAATYDIVSLLRDAYVDWPAARQKKWLNDYQRQARAAGVPLPKSHGELWTAFNVSGAQRGLKVLGIFARLAERDNKPQFCGDMPLAHRHLLAACAALPELSALGEIIAARPPQRGAPRGFSHGAPRPAAPS